MKKLFSILMFILVCIPIVPMIDAEEASSEDQNVVEIWDRTKEGPVYGYSKNDAGILWNCYYYDGYADGHGNYFIEGHNIPANYTLIIEPGVTIHFTGPWGMTVYGSLRAIGTASEPIVFTSNETDPEFDSWDGISTGGGSCSPEITLKYCTFEYSGGLDVWNTNLTVENCEFIESVGIHNNCGNRPNTQTSIVKNSIFHRSSNVKNFLSSVIDVMQQKSAIIDGNEVYGIGKRLVQVGGNEVVFSNNHIEDIALLNIYTIHGGQGIIQNSKFINSLIELDGHFEIIDCDIYNNNSYAFFINLEGGEYSIHNCNIFGNFTYFGNYQNNSINATDNYWGTVDRDEIYDRIHNKKYDILFDEDVDIIFEPYLGMDGDVYVEPGSTDPGPDDTTTYIIIGIVTVLLAILVVVFIVITIKKRKKAKQQDGQEQQTAPLEIQCPQCSHTFTIKSDQRPIKCPKCGREGEV